MLIRAFVPSDADALADLFHMSVHHAAISDYSPEQVAAWSPSKPDAKGYVEQAVGRTFLVAVRDDGTVIGYGDLEPNGHIDHLYCRPDVVGTGVGSAIYAALENAATDAGIETLFVEARCLIPRFDGAILSLEWKEAVWDRFVMGAPRPRTPSEQQYSDRKLRSRR